MSKSTIYVLDTNVLLHDPQSIFSFSCSNIVIPIAVIEEVDNQKRRQDEIGGNARQVSRYLDQLREKGSLSGGIILEHGGSIRVELNHLSLKELPFGFDQEKFDNRILAVALKLSKEHSDVRLVTKDLNLRIKADSIGLPAEDYETDKLTNLNELYSGVTQYSANSEEIGSLYKEHELQLEETHSFHPNQFVILKNDCNPSQSLFARYAKGKFSTLKYSDSEVWGIRGRNKEQRFALELLMDESIDLVTLVGSAGTGKTLLALAAGLDKVVEQGIYNRLLVTRPIVPVGNDIGFLPGNKEEKLKPWMQPIFDNLEFLCSSDEKSSEMVEEFINRGYLEVEALTYIRGRTLPKQYIICDEAQNLSPHMIKTLITRVGEGSKIVFTGDLYQIDNPYLDSTSNGLTYLVEKFKSQEIAGHVTLMKGERSKLAELGARLL